MSESLNVLRTGRYEARGKDGLVTVPFEATRQREEWNLSNEAQKSQRETTGLNENEPIRSIVMHTPGNGMNVCVEPISCRRRQHHTAENPDWQYEHTGVAGQACGEGYSREDGRPHMSPVRRDGMHDIYKEP